MEILSISEVERIELELTNTCNLECPLCMRQVDPNIISKTKYRNLEEIKNQINDYKNLKYITIAGPTSEPTLYPDLFKLLQFLIQKKLEISLFINGDTHNDLYYKKLGMIFRSAIGKIYFTIAGSTQELHSRYRVNGNLENVLRRYEIVQKFSRRAVLTWIVFNYNEKDYKENIEYFKSKYNMETFYTLPVQEHFLLDSDIYLPEPMHSNYINQIRRDNSSIQCPSNAYKFHLISSDGSVNNCSLHKLYGDKHCWECSKDNLSILRYNKIYHLAEPESDTSEIDLKLEK